MVSLYLCGKSCAGRDSPGGAGSSDRIFPGPYPGCFRKCTGKPLNRYVQERKIANAAQELLDTDRTILDIAVAYGFSGRTVFSRAFRRYTGYTPSLFRAEAPLLPRVRLCAGVYGAALPDRQ